MKENCLLTENQLRRVAQTLSRIRKGLQALEVNDLEPVHIFKPFLQDTEMPDGK